MHEQEIAELVSSICDGLSIEDQIAVWLAGVARLAGTGEVLLYNDEGGDLLLIKNTPHNLASLRQRGIEPLSQAAVIGFILALCDINARGARKGKTE